MPVYRSHHYDSNLGRMHGQPFQHKADFFFKYLKILCSTKMYMPKGGGEGLNELYGGAHF